MVSCVGSSMPLVKRLIATPMPPPMLMIAVTSTVAASPGSPQSAMIGAQITPMMCRRPVTSRMRMMTKAMMTFGSRLVVPIVKPLRAPSMKRSRIFFFFAVSGVAICIPSSRIFPVEHLQVHAHQVAADDFEDEHDDDWHDDWCDHVTEYGCAR